MIYCLFIRPSNSCLRVVYVFFPCHVVYFFPCQFMFWYFFKIDTFSCNSCNFKLFVSPCRVHFFIRVVSCFLPCFSYFFVSCQIRISIRVVSPCRVQIAMSTVHHNRNTIKSLTNAVGIKLTHFLKFLMRLYHSFKICLVLWILILLVVLGIFWKMSSIPLFH